MSGGRWEAPRTRHRKPEFIEPELVKFEEKLADITSFNGGYLVDDTVSLP